MAETTSCNIEKTGLPKKLTRSAEAGTTFGLSIGVLVLFE
jgi:hypothetical protein